MAIYRGAGGAGDATTDSTSQAIISVEAAAEAEASAVAAAGSATSASTSATNAATSATNAANSASSASTSATSASNSASAASTSATAAQTAETNAETAEANAELAETNAETAATNAANSASAASTSATNAASSASSASTSATSAASSASTATTQATNASNSATAAATSATSAATSATNAASSATSASNSATSASTSASTATTQATNAANSATAAATSASSASTSATNASNSASAASTSATNASNSASSASTSATNAASSAAAAAASYDDFDDRYLGPKASAPTLDNDGNALQTGALYFNTSTNSMKVYNGSTWLDAYASLSGALLAVNNLSDVSSVSTARTNLGVSATGTDTTYTYRANNLSDLANAATARTNLGLGTAATTNSTAYATAAQGTNADTAFADRYKWDGGSSGLTAATGRASLGGTTVGQNFFTLSNPSAITFPRINADNTVSSLDALTFRTAIGAGTGNGTVTSVSGTSPIASSGGATPAISLASNYGDTLNPYASKTANYVLAAPNGTAGSPTFRALVAADIPTLNQNTTGTASNVTGTVAIANGGTGQTTRQAAMDALAGATTSGYYLRGNGSDVVMSAIQAADVPTLNQSTTGSAATLTTGRTLAITGDLTWTSPSFNGSGNVTAAGTLATVNSNVGSFGSSTSIPVVTVNAKGLVTAVSTATVAGGQYFGSAATKAISYNANSISENVTVTTGNNGLSAGPITINTGYTVTVETGANWVIV